MEYSFIDGRVVREDGYVAIQHVTTNPTNLMVAKTPYIFTPAHNVSLCWVHPDHVDKVLTYKASSGCNCGSSKNKFHLASLINVHLWSGFDREGKQNR